MHGFHHENPKGGRGRGPRGMRGGAVPFPPFGAEFPMSGPDGPRGGRGRGRGPGRGARGDVRHAILALLKDEPMNGYQIISAISEKSQGLWQPSAGSVYPALGLLTDEGLIEAVEVDGKKLHRLTDAGRAHVEQHAAEIGTPWERVAKPHQGFLDVRSEMHQLGLALQQVVLAGDENAVTEARRILDQARKDLYRVLAG